MAFRFDRPITITIPARVARESYDAISEFISGDYGFSDDELESVRELRKLMRAKATEKPKDAPQ